MDVTSTKSSDTALLDVPVPPPHVESPRSRPTPSGTRWWIEVGAALLVAAAYLLGPRSEPAPEVVRRAESNSWSLVELEQRLHLDVEASVQRLVSDAGLLVPVNWLYGTLHFVVTAFVLVHLYRVHPERYERWRTAFVISSVAAFLFQRWWPVAPPRLLLDDSGAPLLVDTLAEHSAPWTFHSGAMSEVANHYAAMPSMHAGWALFCAIALGIGRSRRTRALLLGYPALVTVVIMASGNHYLVDAFGGFAVIGLGLAVVSVGCAVAGRSAAESPDSPDERGAAERLPGALGGALQAVPAGDALRSVGHRGRRPGMATPSRCHTSCGAQLGGHLEGGPARVLVEDVDAKDHLASCHRSSCTREPHRSTPATAT